MCECVWLPKGTLAHIQIQNESTTAPHCMHTLSQIERVLVSALSLSFLLYVSVRVRMGFRSGCVNPGVFFVLLLLLLLLV